MVAVLPEVDGVQTSEFHRSGICIGHASYADALPDVECRKDVGVDTDEAVSAEMIGRDAQCRT
jgi:hypothetical protein